MKTIFALIERVYTIFSFLIFTEALIPVIRDVKGLPPDQSDPLSQLINLVILLGNVLLLVVWYKKVFRTIINEKFIWILLGIILFSWFWSAAPSETLSRINLLFRVTGFSLYFAARYKSSEQLRLLAWVFGIAAVLSLVFALVLPAYGVMGRGGTMTEEALAHVGAWRGIYIHKNSLGRIMVLSGLVFLLLATSHPKKPWVAWGGFGLSVMLILGSTSKTALLTLLILIILLPFYRALRWTYSIAIPFFITAILMGGGVAIVFVSNAEAILGAFGRDLSFTGRVPLWSAVLQKIGEHPWLGYGYGGFWLGLNGESADLWRSLGWEVPHSHNGFLDLCIDIGLLGLSVFVLSFITVCIRSVQWARYTKGADSLWPIFFLTFLIFANLTESSLLSRPFMWILYVMVSLSTYKNRLTLATSETEFSLIKPVLLSSPRSQS